VLSSIWPPPLPQHIVQRQRRRDAAARLQAVAHGMAARRAARAARAAQEAAGARSARVARSELWLTYVAAAWGHSDDALNSTFGRYDGEALYASAQPVQNRAWSELHANALLVGAAFYESLLPMRATSMGNPIPLDPTSEVGAVDASPSGTTSTCPTCILDESSS